MGMNIVRTSEMQPVVHGRWILHDDELMPWFECSECGWSFGNAEKFCAGCGAKMDGERKDDDGEAAH